MQPINYIKWYRYRDVATVNSTGLLILYALGNGSFKEGDMNSIPISLTNYHDANIIKPYTLTLERTCT